MQKCGKSHHRAGHVVCVVGGPTHVRGVFVVAEGVSWGGEMVQCAPCVVAVQHMRAGVCELRCVCKSVANPTTVRDMWCVVAEGVRWVIHHTVAGTPSAHGPTHVGNVTATHSTNVVCGVHRWVK